MRFEICDAVDASGAYDSDCFHRNGLVLAHALEFPGKLRLNKETYLNMQMIYYPGFTIGGMVGEAGGLATLALLWATENAVAWR